MRLLLLLILICFPAFADDEVVLKNGDKLTGKVVGMTKGKLAFQTAHSGTLSIAWDQIASLKTDGKVRVKLTTGEILHGKLSAGDGGRLKIEFTDRLYAYASVELFHDRFRDLRLRTVVSAGGGYLIVKEAAWDLSAEAGVAYVDNDFYEGEDEGHLGGRVNVHLRVSLPLGFELVEDATSSPTSRSRATGSSTTS